MNYFTLLARLLLIAYSILLLLMAIDEGITGEGIIHCISPSIILVVLTALWKRPFWSAIIIFGLSLGSLFLYKTYEQIGAFFIITFPLIVSGILFLLGIGSRKESK